MQLVRYDQARQALAECSRIDDAKDISDKAEALRIYAKQRKDVEMERWVAEIKLRAEMRIGQLSAELDKAESHGGKIRLPNGGKSKADALKSAGISTSQAHRAEQLADHHEDVEHYIADSAAKNQPITIKNALAAVKKKTRQANVQKAIIEQTKTASTIPAVYIDDAVRWLEQQQPADLLLTDPPYSTDVRDIRAFAASWLPLALSKLKPTGRAYVCIGAYPEELAAYLSVAMPQQVLVWTYRNTLGPSPRSDYKLNWQAILYYRSPEAPPLDCPVMVEQFSVQDINAPDGRQGDRYHAWQKPNELAERFVRHASKPGDTVIDPFCCTGTFLIAAARLGRRALGCDIDQDNLALAIKRGCQLGQKNAA